MRSNVILVAETYPFTGAAENNFIDPEIGYLADSFATVIVAPERINGKRKDLDARLLLDTSLAKVLDRSKLAIILHGCLSIEFIRELFLHPWLLFRWIALGRTALFIGRALLTSAWGYRILAERRLKPEDTVFYSFWFFQSAYGFSLLKRRFPSLRVVSRAHGADLYEARHNPQYIPFRQRSVRFVDAVYPDSDAGVLHLKANWPLLSEKFITARLGTTDPGYVAEKSDDGVLRVVSCSSLTPVKRVDLIVKGLAALVQSCPDMIVEWDHFGDGPMRGEIESLARTILPASVRWQLHGHVPSATVMNRYRGRPVDVFVNVSVSEGTPVSIMEATSCGIPIVATAVGGNCEIVSDFNGILLSPDPSPSDLACAFKSFRGVSAKVKALRAGSRVMWREKYSAATNFPFFMSFLRGDELPAQEIIDTGSGCQTC